MRIAIPSSPHEFLQVLQLNVRVAITPHGFEFVFCCAPVTFGVLCVDARGWIDKVERMVDGCVVSANLVSSVTAGKLPTRHCVQLDQPEQCVG